MEEGIRSKIISEIFQDEGLASGIADILNKYINDVVTVEELRSIPEIKMRRKGIKNLTGIEYCTGVSVLDLSVNEISDIRPLSKLKRLTYLDLEWNKIEDIRMLSNLIDLEDLRMRHNNIRQLSNLKKLKILDLGMNGISDISPLANLLNLETLILDDNKIENLSPISGLTKLNYLYLSNNEINNIDALGNLTNLFILRLANNNISDISPLANSTSLSDIDFSNNKIKDISALSGSKLITVNLRNNEISDISALSDFYGHQLILSSNKISDISILDTMRVKSISDLRIDTNSITDFSVLKEFDMLFFSADGQYVRLNNVNIGESTDILIKDKNGDTPNIKFQTSGEYKDGTLKWSDAGINTLTFSDESEISGRIIQSVNSLKAVLFENDNFDGTSKNVFEDITYLQDFNDKVSSIKVSSGITGIRLYEHENYKGEYIDVLGGEKISLKDHSLDNKISSVQVEPFKAVLFENDNFDGTSKNVFEDITNLQDFNDKVSSIKVSSDITGIRLYEHENYKGEYIDVLGGEKISLKDHSLDNKISSVQVEPFKAVLFENDNFDGEHFFVFGDIPDNRDVITKKASIKVSTNITGVRIYMNPNYVGGYIDVLCGEQKILDIYPYSSIKILY